MAIFHCYVSSPEGIDDFTFIRFPSIEDLIGFIGDKHRIEAINKEVSNIGCKQTLYLVVKNWGHSSADGVVQQVVPGDQQANLVLLYRQSILLQSYWVTAYGITFVYDIAPNRPLFPLPRSQKVAQTAKRSSLSRGRFSQARHLAMDPQRTWTQRWALMQVGPFMGPSGWKFAWTSP